MNERIKMVRKKLGMKQDEFGLRLGISRDAVSNLEVGRVKPSESIIKLICKEFGINQEWLKTGRGDQFTPPNDAYLDLLVEDFELDATDARILKAYLRLTKSERDVIKKYIKEIQLGE